MNKSTLALLFWLFSAATLFSACEEEIELDLPDNEPELVVEGYLCDLDFYIPEGDLDCSGLLTISHEELLLAAYLAAGFDLDSSERVADYFPFNKVVLTSTSNYFDSSNPPSVSGATVKLFEDGNLVETLIEDPAIAGTYRITYDPKAGSYYHLEIDALDQFYVTEKELYGVVPPLFEVSARFGPNFIGDTCAYYMGISTFEKPGLNDHYRWMFYLNNKYVQDPVYISTSDDAAFDGLCLFEFDVYGNELELGDTLVVFQMHTSQNYFDFINSLRNQTAFVGSPFDTPPAPIRGNVKNESKDAYAQGFFAVGGISANAVVVPDTVPAGDCP